MVVLLSASDDVYPVPQEGVHGCAHQKNLVKDVGMDDGKGLE